MSEHPIETILKKYFDIMADSQLGKSNEATKIKIQSLLDEVNEIIDGIPSEDRTSDNLLYFKFLEIAYDTYRARDWDFSQDKP